MALPVLLDAIEINFIIIIIITAMSQSPAALRLSRKLQANLVVYKAPHQHVLVSSLTTSLEITS